MDCLMYWWMWGLLIFFTGCCQVYSPISPPNTQANANYLTEVEDYTEEGGHVEERR
ncbi:MAG: hypothetical protein K9M07_07620 [Simkaniaceae bacterium]|nr:hypothetical protein [Simkaniaceae bacterium]